MADWEYKDYLAIGIPIGIAIGGWVFSWLALKKTQQSVNINRDQQRQNILLESINRISDNRARDNRALIHQNINSPSPQLGITAQTVKVWIDEARRVSFDNALSIRMKEAIEETISCLDVVGYFISKSDPLTKKESPEWLWTITKEMWSKLGPYVIDQQSKHAGYGKYFKELYDMAIEMTKDQVAR